MLLIIFSKSIFLQLVELLSVRAPSPETKLKLLKEIAQEHQLDWDPASTETDLFKSHEDLLVSTLFSALHITCQVLCLFTSFFLVSFLGWTKAIWWRL